MGHLRIENVEQWSEQLVAIGQTFLPERSSNEGLAWAYPFGGVHLDDRGWGISRQLLAAQERRGAKLAGRRYPCNPRIWFVDGGIRGAVVQPMLDRRG